MAPYELEFKNKEEASSFVEGLGSSFIAGLDECGRGCERPDAEVLTKRGWKHYSDILKDDKVLSYTDEHKMVWQPITAVIEKDFDGDLVKLTHRGVNIVVTADHYFTTLQRVFERDKQDNNKLKLVGYRTKYKNVEELVDNDFIPRLGDWEGEKPDFFYIPPIEVISGFRGPETRPEKFVDMKKWVAFLGIYIAEGCCTLGSKGEYIVHISQSKKSPHYNAINKLLTSLPFNFSPVGDVGFVVMDKQLYETLSPLGDAISKFVPSYMKDLDSTLINIFLDWAVYGDGTCQQGINRKPFRRYYTSSIRLKNDIEEMLLKAGYTFNTIVKSEAGSKRTIKGRVITATVDNYQITFRRSPRFAVKYLKKSLIPYKGKVFCLSLPEHHNFFVRRSGTGYFTGNSLSGPVVAACVLLPPDHGIEGIADSKKISARNRKIIYEQLIKFPYGIGSCENTEIDEINIFQATQKAAMKAFLELQAEAPQVEHLLCDGSLDIRKYITVPSNSIIKGDLYIECIGAASIIAKVFRDTIMEAYHDVWPEYNFKSNKGYGTKAHTEAIIKYGISPIHRRSFGICRTAKERLDV